MTHTARTFLLASVSLAEEWLTVAKQHTCHDGPELDDAHGILEEHVQNAVDPALHHDSDVEPAAMLPIARSCRSLKFAAFLIRN